MSTILRPDGQMEIIPTPVPLPVYNPIGSSASLPAEPAIVPAEEPYDEAEEPYDEEITGEETGSVGESRDTESPVSDPTNEADDDFSDVTGLSAEDEEELFGLGEGNDDPTSSDDDLDDILGLSDKDNKEIFGLGGETHTKRYKNTRAGRRALRRRVSPPSSLGGVGY